MAVRKLKRSELPAVKLALLKRQGNRCVLCGTQLGPALGPDTVLDHDHTFGFIRAVLCRNCNGIEGKIKNLSVRAKRDKTPSEWLTRLIQYWAAFSPDRCHGQLDLHPGFAPGAAPKKMGWGQKKPVRRK